jgi:hypothetical protein
MTVDVDHHTVTPCDSVTVLHPIWLFYGEFFTVTSSDSVTVKVLH